MVDSRDLAHVAVSLVALGGLGDILGGLFGIALGFVVQTEVEVAVELAAGEGSWAGIAGLDGVQHQLLGAFAGKEGVDFLQRHAPVGGDFDELLLGFLHAVDF